MEVHKRASLSDLGIGDIVAERIRYNESHGMTSLIAASSEAINEAVDQWFAGSGEGLADRVGPVYSSVDVHRLLDRDRRLIASKRDHATILALRTRDGQWVYPTFQFLGSSVDDRFVPFFKIFATSLRPQWWNVAAWFRTPRGDLGDRTPADVIRSGDRDSTNRAHDVAQQMVNRWNRDPTS